MRFLTIPNHELGPDDIPDLGTGFDEHWHELALSFNGYAHHGGLSGCGDRANPALALWEKGGRPTGPLSELRSWLFFEQRRSNHLGDTHRFDYVEYLVESIRVFVEAGEGAEGGRNRRLDGEARRATAITAEELPWAWVRYDVGERFRLEVIADQRDRRFAIGQRRGIPYALRQTTELEAWRGYWEVMPFANTEERHVFTMTEAGLGSARGQRGPHSASKA